MKRLLIMVVTGCFALWVATGDAMAWGRRHHHGRHGTRVHLGFFYTSPVYPPPHYWHAPHHHYGHRVYRPHGLVLAFPVVVWHGLSDYERTLASHSTYQALEYMRSGDAVEWHDPDTGHSGKVSPQPAYQNAQGAYCREFQQTVRIGGQEQVAYGTACRQPDGSWRMVR